MQVLFVLLCISQLLPFYDKIEIFIEMLNILLQNVKTEHEDKKAQLTQRERATAVHV